MTPDGQVPGRLSKAGTEQINEALVLRVATEFKGFVRDLLDLATIKMVRGCGCSPAYQAQVITAMSRGRMIDRAMTRPPGQQRRDDAAELQDQLKPTGIGL